MIVQFGMRLTLHVDNVQLYRHKKAIHVCSLVMCVMCTLREDQENLLQSSVSDKIDGDRQEPTIVQANPAHLSVINTQPFTMSADAVYSTIDEDDHQNILRDNLASSDLEKSVA